MMEEFTKLNEAEAADCTRCLHAIREGMMAALTEDVSFRGVIVAFMIALEMAFETMGYTRKEVKEALQNMINHYNEENADEPES